MSAGNESQNISYPSNPIYIGKYRYPSCFRFDNTIAVGSINSNNDKSDFSNYGSNWVDIAAPGSSIISTVRNNQYASMYGTSMSAPHVAGAAALLCAAYPSLSASQIKTRLMIGANKSYGVTQGYWSQGILDVWTALILPMINTTSLPGGTVGTYYNQSINASSIVPVTLQISGGSLPTGLSLNSSTGVISGTPTVAGTFNFIVGATNSGGSNFVTMSIVINVAAPIITTSSLPGGTVGTAYYQALSATGATPITWSIYNGNLPSGLSLNSSTGVISGTPTVANAYNFTVMAQNSGGYATKSLSIGIIANIVAPVITTTSLPNGNAGTAYSQALSATGTTPITWSVNSGALPTGLSLNSSTGVVSGTPTTAGTYNFTIKATNSAGSDTKSLMIIVSSGPVSLTGGSIVVGGESYNNGEYINVWDLDNYGYIEFVPTPYNATINSVEWGSNVASFTYPNQIASSLYDIDYDYSFVDHYISVTVNGSYTIQLVVWNPISP